MSKYLQFDSKTCYHKLTRMERGSKTHNILMKISNGWTLKKKKKRKRALTFSGEVVQLFEVCIREEQVKGT